MDWLFLAGIGLFLLVLMLTIAVHEAGHMGVAKLLKLDVPEYSIGFGPKLLSKKTKKTVYNLRAVPLGGFVQIQDQRYPEKSYERDALSRVSPWKRQLVFSAGPLVNIVLGVILLLGVLMLTPYNQPSNHVAMLHTCESSVGCAAAEAGLLEGDEIVNIDGIPVSSFEDLTVAKEGKATLDTLTVLRGNEEITFNNMALHEDPENGAYYIGIQATEEAYRSLSDAWTFVTFSFEQNLIALLHLPEKVPVVVENVFTGDKAADDPASVVAAGKSYGDMAASTEIKESDKVFTFIYWSALFNIGIGLINLLPMLPLDGGRMWIAFCDSVRMRWAKIRKKDYEPVTQRMFLTMTAVSAVAVFGVMLLVIASDISAWVAGSI